MIQVIRIQLKKKKNTDDIMKQGYLKLNEKELIDANIERTEVIVLQSKILK